MPATTPILDLPYPVTSETVDVVRDIQALADKLDTMTGIAAPALVTSLPGTPSDGQEVYYQTAAMAALGTVWHLRYRTGAAGTYKWEFVGGPSLSANTMTREPSTALGTVHDLATAGPLIDAPVAGEYLVHWGATVFAGAAAGTYETLTHLYAGATAIAYGYIVKTTDTGVWEQNAFTATAKAVITAGQQFKVRYQQNGGVLGACLWSNRWVTVQPVRVG